MFALPNLGWWLQAPPDEESSGRLALGTPCRRPCRNGIAIERVVAPWAATTLFPAVLKEPVFWWNMVYIFSRSKTCLRS